MFRVTFVARIAIGSKLLKPVANVVFRDIVPLGIGLQAQIDAHLRVLFLTGRLLHFPSTFALVGGHSFSQFGRWMEFFIEFLDIGGTKEGFTTHSAMSFDTPLFDPLIERD